MLLVVCQLSRDVIGCEGSTTVLFRTTFTRTVMLNLLMYRLRVYRTARTVSTLYCTNRTLAVPSVRLYRFCSRDRLSAQKQPEVFIQPNSEQLWKGNALLKYQGFFFTFSNSTGALFCFFLFSMHIFGSILDRVISMSISSKRITINNF